LAPSLAKPTQCFGTLLVFAHDETFSGTMTSIAPDQLKLCDCLIAIVGFKRQFQTSASCIIWTTWADAKPQNPRAPSPRK
jgi:hypothetical protein